MDQKALERAVSEVVAAVRKRGDDALCEFTRRWDGVDLTPQTLRVPPTAIVDAQTESDFGKAFRRAADRIRRFHAEVKPRSVTVDDPDGARLGIRGTPIRAVGLYIPGGKASYPSTLAMTAVPAQIAGVERIVVVSPPGADVSEHVLLAANILGIDEIYRVGGAQAVAALALGTETIPQVDKIFGPGNAFVAEAKKQLYGEVGIDLLAGPSEVVVYADHTADPEWIAADLMAQAEHDEDTRTTLLASDATVLEAVRGAIARRIDEEPRRDVIAASFEQNGTLDVVSTHAEAAERINQIAPEHLSIQIDDPNAVLPSVRNAGAIFLGKHSPVAMGDYYAGPNHVLPTGRTARFASCLSVEDFMKRSNVCETTAGFVERHGADVEILADGEQLPAHRSSIAVRRRGAPRGARAGFASVDAYQLVDEEGDVKLNQNESPWDIPVEVKDEIFAEMRSHTWNRYHQKVGGELQERVAQSVGIDPRRVFVGNGSNLLMQWIFEAFVGPGRRVLIPSPSFSLYRMWGRLTESQIADYRLVESGRRFDYPAGEIAALVREQRPALTVLCLPNNPTGSELEMGDLEGIVETVESVGGWLLIDEAYREFSGPEFDRTRFSVDGNRVFLLRTFSKAFSAAGLRIGYLLTNSEGADAMLKIVPPFHLSLFNAVAGKVLWRRREIFDERIDQLLAERERVMKALAGVRGLEVFASSANFFMIRVAQRELLHEDLERRGILIRKLWKDPLLEKCLRINVGTPEENDRLLSAIREFEQTGGFDGPGGGKAAG